MDTRDQPGLTGLFVAQKKRPQLGGVGAVFRLGNLVARRARVVTRQF
jgi:hypothetical protein